MEKSTKYNIGAIVCGLMAVVAGLPTFGLGAIPFLIPAIGFLKMAHDEDNDHEWLDPEHTAWWAKSFPQLYREWRGTADWQQAETGDDETEKTA